MKSTTRTVRFGDEAQASSFSNTAASIAIAQPAPSSFAPSPTSHESMWPPITTISAGSSRPVSSATTFALSASGSVFAPIASRS